MIDIVQYRASIGSFAGVSLKQNQLMRDVDGICLGDLYKEYEHWPHLFMNYVKHYLFQYLGIYETINQSVVNLKLLLLSNDIETNPGPEFTKIISGNFNQGNEKFQNVAGKQCAAISLYALAFSTVKDVKYWTADTLDSIVEKGTSLYEGIVSKKVVEYDFLAREDLPNVVEIFDEPILIHYQFNTHGLLNKQELYLDRMKDIIFTNGENSTGFLIWLSNTTISVIVKRKLSNDKIYTSTQLTVFDSHARDCNGRISHDGVSVLMFFDDINRFIDYLCNTYLHVQDSLEHLLPYQIQFVQCICSMTNEKRKKVVRLHKSSLENANRLEKLKQNKKLQRAGETSVQTTIRLEKLKRDERLRRANETDIDTTIRLEKLKRDKRLRRANETGIDTTIRLEKLKQDEKLRRINETCVERSSRLSRKRQCEKLRKSSETCVEKSLRLDMKRLNEKKKRLSIEIVSKKLLRLARLKQNEKLKQYNETCADKSFRLTKLQCNEQLNILQENVREQSGRHEKKRLCVSRKSKVVKHDTETIRYRTIGNNESISGSNEFSFSIIQRELNMVYDSSSSYASNITNVKSFLCNINEGPYYICACCNRGLYRKSVRKFQSNVYSVNIFMLVPSFDNKEYICNTCHLKVRKGKIPCQAVCNKLKIDEIPSVLETLRKLESILIARRIVFQKIIIMPKGQQRKIKGAICNVPINCETVCQSLPRPSELSGVILLKLKRKLQYSGHQYCEAIRPDFIRKALDFLKENNPLYQNIEINMNNVETNPLHDVVCQDSTTNASTTNSNFSEHIDNADEHSILESTNNVNSDPMETCDEEEIDDPQNQYRVSVNETCLESYVPNYPVEINQYDRNNDIYQTTSSTDQPTLSGNEICSIAPGEGKHPIHFMQDKNCEEMAFPVLFPRGQFGYQAEREVKLSPTKYFNTRLLNYTGRFGANPEYLFFAQFITEQKKVQDSINIALKKVTGQSLTASQVRNFSSGTMNHLIFSDQAYYFMKNIPGSPAYWKTFLYDVVAMIKQLGPPTWWLTLSCADLRWIELFRILSKLEGKEMTDIEFEHMSYDERCKMLNSNPVVVAKHFQYRLEHLFRDVLLGSGNTIGEILYHAIRIEFQFRGSPHAHCFIWIKDAPVLNEDKDFYINK